MFLYIPFGIDSCLWCSLLVFPSGKYVLYFEPEFRNTNIVRNTNIEKYLDVSNSNNCFLAINEIPIEAKNIMGILLIYSLASSTSAGINGISRWFAISL